MKNRKRALTVCVILLIITAIVCVLSVDSIQKKLYPQKYSEYVSFYANEYGVPEALVYAVIHTESNFDPEAKSSAGAYGLMQLIPDTVDWLSRLIGEESPVDSILDPQINVKYGTYYLRHLYDRFGNWDTALAAYNAGHGRVANWLDDSRYSSDGVELREIPIAETKNYVNKVKNNFETYNKLYYNGEQTL